MKETVRAFTDFLKTIGKYGASGVKAVGTSALREAGNADEFINLVKRETGVDINIISGREEADLTARGVLSSFREKATILIIDIGGGSTEAILCKSAKVVDTRSFPVGVVKMKDMFIHSDPPSNGQLMAIDSEAENVAKAIREGFHANLTDDTFMIATAGTATTIASIDLGLKVYDHSKVQMHKISFDRLVKISKNLSSLPLETRKNVKGLDPDRADLIIPGIRLTIKLMEGLDFNNFFVSDHGLLEGVLLKFSEEVLA